MMNIDEPVRRPSLEHQDRVALLDNLAILMGFNDGFVALPTYLRPDVSRSSTQTGGLFIRGRQGD